MNVLLGWRKWRRSQLPWRAWVDQVGRTTPTPIYHIHRLLHTKLSWTSQQADLNSDSPQIEHTKSIEQHALTLPPNYPPIIEYNLERATLWPYPKSKSKKENLHYHFVQFSGTPWVFVRYVQESGGAGHRVIWLQKMRFWSMCPVLSQQGWWVWRESGVGFYRVLRMIVFIEARTCSIKSMKFGLCVGERNGLSVEASENVNNNINQEENTLNLIVLFK